MLRLKSLHEQVVVLTGGTSGIGLTTARQAAGRGARLVLAARNEEALRDVAEELRSQGAEAVHVVADVTRREDVARIGEEAIRTFGRIDSWINDAAVAIYGRLEDVSIEDHRRLFETNYWGLVYGSLTAVRHLRRSGGALVNIGSILSDVPIPLQGPYVAAKHAVKGFTDSLRMELEADGAPVSVTLVKPAAISTPYVEHGRNYLDRAPKNPPPLYAPDLVAEAILHACEHPRRELYVGGGGRTMVTMANLFPRFFDRMAETTMGDMQRTDLPPDTGSDRRDNLYEPKADGAERPRHEGFVRERSLYTSLELRPGVSLGLAAAAGLAALGLLTSRRRSRNATRYYP